MRTTKLPPGSMGSCKHLRVPTDGEVRLVCTKDHDIYQLAGGREYLYQMPCVHDECTALSCPDLDYNVVEID